MKAYAFRNDHVLELRHAPISVEVYCSNRNSNLLSSLIGPVNMRLDLHSEFVFNIRRFKQAVKQLSPDDEYTFAMIDPQVRRHSCVLSIFCVSIIKTFHWLFTCTVHLIRLFVLAKREIQSVVDQRQHDARNEQFARRVCVL